MENRVLTQDEVRNLPNKSKVFVEYENLDGAYSVASKDGNAVLRGKRRPSDFLVVGRFAHDGFGTHYRVWLRDPTPEDIAGNPWP